jgi:hypothetical protein
LISKARSAQLGLAAEQNARAPSRILHCKECAFKISVTIVRKLADAARTTAFVKTTLQDSLRSACVCCINFTIKCTYPKISRRCQQEQVSQQEQTSCSGRKKASVLRIRSRPGGEYMGTEGSAKYNAQLGKLRDTNAFRGHPGVSPRHQKSNTFTYCEPEYMKKS